MTRNPKRYTRPAAAGKRGQVMVIGALTFVALLMVAGLAVDGGRAYVNRRSLQAAADSGADSAMRMLLQDYRDVMAGRAQTYSDCQIATKVGELTKPRTPRRPPPTASSA